MRKEFKEALERTIRGGRPRHEDLVLLLQGERKEEELLFLTADQVRERHMGDEIHLRGIIEFSNHCRNDCQYCGLRRSNGSLPRYRLSTEMIVQVAQKAEKMGLRTIVLQSGEDLAYSAERIAEAIEEIKERSDLAITLSVGERSREEYQRMKEAGADRFLLKFETSDPDLFSSLRPRTRLQDRLRCLEWLRETGFQVGSGNIVGLPGQDLKILADDLLLLRDLEVEMAGIGPFIPHPQTPLGGHPAGSISTTLRVLAVARLTVPEAHLPATTALGTLSAAARERALCSGANVIMPNLTPRAYREYYQIYPGRIHLREDPEVVRESIVAMAHSLGRKISADYGHSLRYLRRHGSLASPSPVKIGPREKTHSGKATTKQ